MKPRDNMVAEAKAAEALACEASHREFESPQSPQGVWHSGDCA